LYRNSQGPYQDKPNRPGLIHPYQVPVKQVGRGVPVSFEEIDPLNFNYNLAPPRVNKTKMDIPTDLEDYYQPYPSLIIEDEDEYIPHHLPRHHALKAPTAVPEDGNDTKRPGYKSFRHPKA
jgi:hypothetical protein